jgi:hypothetical protein
MPFHSFPSAAGLAVLLSAHAVQAYTVINVDNFMYKNIDPIVYPGQYSKSHLHSFFGSDAVTASTKTSAELQAGCTTAENPNDLSVYCMSALGPISKCSRLSSVHDSLMQHISLRTAYLITMYMN